MQDIESRIIRDWNYYDDCTITDYKHVKQNGGTFKKDGMQYSNQCFAISLGDALQLGYTYIGKALGLEHNEEFDEEKHGKKLVTLCDKFYCTIFIYAGEKLNSGNIKVANNPHMAFKAKNTRFIVNIIQYIRHFELWNTVAL